MQNFFERHARLTLTLSVVLSIFLLLGLAELLVRQILPQWAPVTAERSIFWQFDPLLGWKHIPSTRAIFSHPDFSVPVTINSHGLRDHEYAIERNQKKRILILGDSYGWGFGVADHEIFSELLEAQRPDWEIINASVSGYGTVQQYLYYREHGALYKPDVVLLLFHDNDFRDNIGDGAYWYDKPFVSEKADEYVIAGVPVAEPSWLQRLQTVLLGRFYIGRLLYPIVAAPLEWFSQNETAMGETHVSAFPATQYVLGEFAKTASANQARLVIVNTPLAESKSGVIESVCKQYELSCLSLNPLFRQHKNEKWHFEHDRHWNAHGHALVAGAIEQFFSQNGVW